MGDEEEDRVYDTVTLDEMDFVEEDAMYYYQCPCGDKFELSVVRAHARGGPPIEPRPPLTARAHPAIARAAVRLGRRGDDRRLPELLTQDQSASARCSAVGGVAVRERPRAARAREIAASSARHAWSEWGRSV